MAEVIKYKGIWKKTFKTGDSFKERIFTGRANYATPTTTLTDVRIKFRKESETGTLQKYIYVGSGITINDASIWKFTISKFEFDWNVGKYYADVETTDSDGNVDTNFSMIFEIEQDVTTEGNE